MGTHVAVQNTRTRSWNAYGIVMFIGPHRQYHICTTRGKMLVWNCCFFTGRFSDLYLKEGYRVKLHSQSRYRVRTLKRHNQSRGDQLVRANLSPD